MNEVGVRFLPVFTPLRVNLLGIKHFLFYREKNFIIRLTAETHTSYQSLLIYVY